MYSRDGTSWRTEVFDGKEEIAGFMTEIDIVDNGAIAVGSEGTSAQIWTITDEIGALGG